MASWTSLTGSTTETPVTTPFATFGGFADCKITSGVIAPVTVASNSGCVSTTTFSPTDDATTTEGLVARWTWNAFYAGHTTRLIYSYTDANNYYYLNCEQGAVSVTAGYTRDSVTLWKRVSGTETQIGTGTTLKKRQKTVGDLRWHTLSSSYPLTVYHVYDNHWVFIDELCFIHESDSALSAGGAVGVYFPGLASHTTSVSNVQAQLLQSYWCASDGSDSATGARAAPFSTRNKLYATVGLNQIGIMRTRTFTGGTVVATQSSVTGTSHEEGPFLTNYAGETVQSEWHDD